MNIVHVIEGHEFGGVEVAVENLMLHTEGRTLAGDVIHNRMITLRNYNFVCDRIAKKGFSVTPLNIYRLPHGPISGFLRLARLIRRSRPVIVNAWYPRPNLLAALAGYLTGRPPLIWQFHANAPVSVRDDLPSPLRGLPSRLCGPLSHHIPDANIYVANTPRRFYGLAGFHVHDKAHVIYNGIDCDRFRPDPEARSAMRRELGLADNTLLVGIVTRVDHVKDPGLFLSAFGRLKTENVHGILCGPEVDSNNASLIRMVNDAGVADRVHLLGFRDDMPRLAASLDVAVNSSLSVAPFVLTEAHPIAIGEALAAGVPCVTTDIGDITEPVSLAGHVVHSRNPEDMAAAVDSILALSSQERMTLGQRGRQYVIENYSMEANVQKWMGLYESMASRANGRGPSSATAP